MLIGNAICVDEEQVFSIFGITNGNNRMIERCVAVAPNQDQFRAQPELERMCKDETPSIKPANPMLGHDFVQNPFRIEKTVQRRFHTLSTGMDQSSVVFVRPEILNVSGAVRLCRWLALMSASASQKGQLSSSGSKVGTGT